MAVIQEPKLIIPEKSQLDIVMGVQNAYKRLGRRRFYATLKSIATVMPTVEMDVHQDVVIVEDLRKKLPPADVAKIKGSINILAVGMIHGQGFWDRIVAANSSR